MGCSDAYEIHLSPEQAREADAEEKRQALARRLIYEVPLNQLTVGDLLSLVGVFRPEYPYHTWNSLDTDALVLILRKVGKWPT